MSPDEIAADESSRESEKEQSQATSMQNLSIKSRAEDVDLSVSSSLAELDETENAGQPVEIESAMNLRSERPFTVCPSCVDRDITCKGTFGDIAERTLCDRASMEVAEWRFMDSTDKAGDCLLQDSEEHLQVAAHVANVDTIQLSQTLVSTAQSPHFSCLSQEKTVTKKISCYVCFLDIY